ncbi:MAG: DUF885 domain-containing protein [Deltaproteobacteria bacterium]|nr:MAG: DUF885 domain-containing protein [Deltaproteobacteria bacterium]
MIRSNAAFGAILLAGCAATAPVQPTPTSKRYEDLAAFFAAWRAFQRPKLADGVPDYTASSMAAQHRELAEWQRRLEAFDTTGWTAAQKVDRDIVRAEMNGLDFDHRVLMPWARDPAFYVTVFDEESDQPAREGHQASGSVELWKRPFPVGGQDASELAVELQPIPALLDQARKNLTGNARDLWVYGTASMKAQSAALSAFGEKVPNRPVLSAAVKRAREATDAFVAWLEQQAPSRTGPSGIGKANYDWYLANVQLVPYTWSSELLLMTRELARARSSLALEEDKNRALPPLRPVASAAEHTRRFNAAITEYVAYLRDNKILTLRDWMEPALRARIGHFTPGEKREFFTEVDYRDPVMMRTHGYHWIDLAWMEHEPNPSPVRREPLLYNIFNTRTEGFATAMEELMLHEGLFDERPRSREMIWILVAQRAARALGELHMQGENLPLEDAARLASENTPRGWLRLDGQTVWGEQHLYLRQPGYGTSYLVGKMLVDELIAARAQELGSHFTMQRFMDELNATGLIPITLVARELTTPSPATAPRQ